MGGSINSVEFNKHVNGTDDTEWEVKRKSTALEVETIRTIS